MRRILLGFIALSATSLFLYSCKKSNDGVKPENSTNTPADLASLHGLGLNAMDPSDWAGVPAFSASLFSNLQTNGLSYSGTQPESYLLTTPQIRDQGQLGACTGFCGTETDEILYFYKNNPSSAGFTGLTTATGITTAAANEIPNTSEETYYTNHSTSAAFSPLFLYFVERVVINKGSISSDNGANMVNIGEALQGLSSNSGSGKKLTYSSYTFDGISPEADYPYPWKTGSGGYNVATSSTTPFKVYPYSYFSYGSTTIPVAPNNYPIGKQSGTTTSSGATAEGYYVINDTQSALVNDVKVALLNNKPVMMGFNVYDKSPSYPYFESLSTTSYTYNPLTTSGAIASGAKLLGGHAVPIVGYINDSTQPGGGVFICQNSWGTPWGNHGYFYLPYSVIESTKIVPSGSLYVMIL